MSGAENIIRILVATPFAVKMLVFSLPGTVERRERNMFKEVISEYRRLFISDFVASCCRSFSAVTVEHQARVQVLHLFVKRRYAAFTAAGADVDVTKISAV